VGGGRERERKKKKNNPITNILVDAATYCELQHLKRK